MACCEGIPCGPLKVFKLKQNIKKVKLLQDTVFINLWILLNVQKHTIIIVIITIIKITKIIFLDQDRDYSYFYIWWPSQR